MFPKNQIETFCFEEGGVMKFKAVDFVAKKDGKEVDDVRAGFVMVKTSRYSRIH